MFEAAVYDRNLSDPRLLELQAELDRTREELETFRRTTAQILTAILTELHGRVAPSGTPTEILKLADLTESDRAEMDEDPLSGEIESIDVRNRESLAYLDRRFRWLPSARRSAN